SCGPVPPSVLTLWIVWLVPVLLVMVILSMPTWPMRNCPNASGVGEIVQPAAWAGRCMTPSMVNTRAIAPTSAIARRGRPTRMVWVIRSSIPVSRAAPPGDPPLFGPYRRGVLPLVMRCGHLCGFAHRRRRHRWWGDRGNRRGGGGDGDHVVHVRITQSPAERGIAEAEDPAIRADQPVALACWRGGEVHDGRHQLGTTHRVEEAGVTEVEDAAIGRGQPVAVPGGCRSHADDRRVQSEASQRPVEGRITEREDTAVGGHQPVPIPRWRRSHADNWRVQWLSA